MAIEQQLDQEKLCPACKRNYLELLTRNVYDDKSVTTYYRCPSCSHVRIEETPPEGSNPK